MTRRPRVCRRSAARLNRSARSSPLTSSITRATTAALPRARAGALVEPVSGRDVRAIEGGQDLRLSAKAADPLGVLGQRRGQNLYRHVAVELRVTRAEHVAHAARTYGGCDFVRAETISRRQH
jgi:hypothetical protein